MLASKSRLHWCSFKDYRMEIAFFGILVALGAMTNGITETNSSCLCTCMYSFEGNTEPAIAIP